MYSLYIRCEFDSEYNAITNGKSLVFAVSTTGYKDLQLSYTSYFTNDRNRTRVGFELHDWAYSTDGVNYTPFGNRIDLTGEERLTQINRTVDFSSITSLNNVPKVYLRLTINGSVTNNLNASIGITLDNVVIKGTPLPSEAKKISAWYFDEMYESGELPFVFPADVGDGIIYANGNNGSSLFTAYSELTQFNGIITNDDRDPQAASYALGVTQLNLLSEELSERRKSIVFKFSSMGYQNLLLTYGAINHPYNPLKNHSWAYSTDGENFTPITTLSISSGRRIIDLSPYTALNNISQIYLRLRVEAASFALDNYESPVDNIIITGEEIPPSPVKIAGWHFDRNYSPSLTQYIAEDGLLATLYLDGTHGSSVFTSAPAAASTAQPATGELYTNGGGDTASDDREKPFNGNGIAIYNIDTAPTNGKNMVFTLSTIGYKDLSLSYYRYNNTVGFGTQVWAYSTNGTDFTDVTTLDATSSGVYTVDLSAVTALNNVSLVYLRLTISGASARIVGPYTIQGQSRIDNVSLTGIPLSSEKQKITAWYFDDDYGIPSAPGLEIPAEFGDGVLYANGANGSSSFDNSSGTYIVQYEGLTTNDDRQPAEQTFSISVHNLNKISENIAERRKWVIFKFSAAAYKDMQLSYAAYQETSWRDHNWAYSTDGVNYTTIGSSFPVTSGKRIIDLSPYTTLNNAPEVYLRLRFEYVEGAGGLDQGYTMVDNIIISGTPSTLPVSLTTFTATAYTNEVRLNWATASEQNNAYFEVFRSSDGKNYNIVGRQQGAGTTAEPNNYSLTDYTPIAGISYYQLKQVDTDGKVSIYGPVSVQYALESKKGDISLYPNPVTGGQVYIKVAESGSVTIYSTLGQQIKTQVLQAELNTIDLSNLVKGVYYAVVNGKAVKFLKE